MGDCQKKGGFVRKHFLKGFLNSHNPVVAAAPLDAISDFVRDGLSHLSLTEGKDESMPLSNFPEFVSPFIPLLELD